MASTTTSKQRASAAGVAVTLGLATVVVDWVPASVSNKDKASQFHSLCAKCDEPTRLRQVLACPHGHEPITIGDVTRRGKEIGGSLVDVTAGEIAGVRGDAADASGVRTMHLEVVRSHELLEKTLPGSSVYRLRPGKASADGGYDMLRLLVAEALKSGRVLIGEFAVRSGAAKLMWIGLRRGQVLAYELLRPSDVAEFDEISETDLPDKVQVLAGELVKQMTVKFDPERWVNATRLRAEELLASKGTDGGATITTIVRPAVPAEADLESLLSAMLNTA